ncbi:MAG: hypothetical protein SAK29_08850 [Scytonema sp. PMC 1069.18]|nr:hypothetical protein [Scytonema sp. PMC 1069.18]MEC4884802.1 hypothetical protein [Scytonema sp. PMC 1070.18]
MTQIPEQKQTTPSEQSSENSTSADNTNADTFIETESASIEVVELEELSAVEVVDRLTLERKVERAFYESGKALMQLRDRRLYRSTHKTFEEYCRDRFGYTRVAAFYKITAATVVDNLLTNGYQNPDEPTEGLQNSNLLTNGYQNPDMLTKKTQILPTNERQIRPLTQLEPEQQLVAWQLSVEASGGQVPSGRVVKDIVQRIMKRTKVPNPYRMGEVCQFVIKDNPDLKGKGRCWCIVSQVNEFSCTVVAWDGEYTVKIEHLKSMNYSDGDCQQRMELCDRINKLRNKTNLEDAARANLKHLGEIKRPYLTPLEEKLLSVLETEYGVG